MTARTAIAIFALCACAACTLINPAKQRAPEQRECRDGQCEQDPCSACDPRASCRDGRCRCPAGARDVLGDGTQCETEAPGCQRHADCGDHARCVRREDGASCACMGGYAQTERGCENVDECAAGLHACGEHARCVDGDGNHSCSCLPGFSGDGKNCVDDDECAADPCAEHASCVNSAGGFGCECDPGYVEDGRNGCIDSDECAQGTLQCSERARCQDRPGPDGCACLPYYSDARADGSECRDDRVSWSLWLGGDVQVSVTPVAPLPTAPGTPPREELVAIAGPLLTETRLCGETFAPGDGPSTVVAVLTAKGECRWANAFPTAEARSGALAVDEHGAVVVSAWVRSGVVLDGHGVSVAGEPSSGAVLRFAADGTLDWIQRAPCAADSELGSFDDLALAIDVNGDIYALLQYERECDLDGRVLPKVSGRAHGVVRYTRTGTVLWTAVVEPAEGSIVYFFDLAVAPDGNLYVAGRFTGSVDFGLSAFATGTQGFVHALGTNGVPRWLRTFDELAVLTVAAGTGDGVQAVTYGEQDADIDGTAYELRGLEPRAGAELWRAPAVSNVTRWSLSTDLADATVFAGTVPDTAVLAGEALTTEPGGTRGFMLAYAADGALRWSHAFEPNVTAIRSAALTPRGVLIATGHCRAACQLGDGQRSEDGGHFVLGMRP